MVILLGLACLYVCWRGEESRRSEPRRSLYPVTLGLSRTQYRTVHPVNGLLV